MTTPPLKKPRKRTAPDTRLFRFTPAEEEDMQRAIRESIIRMRTFGQAPARPMIDLTHYENSLHEEQCHQEKNTK